MSIIKDPCPASKITFASTRIHSINAVQSYANLSKPKKSPLNLLTYKDSYQETLLTQTIMVKIPENSRFVPANSGKSLTRQKTFSENRLSLTSRSRSKENLIKKRDFSIEEQDEIDSIIQKKLKKQFKIIRNAITDRIHKISQHKIFSDKLYALRAESLTEVQSKAMERKIFPQLKKEAQNEILKKRKLKPQLDKYSKRIQLLEKMENLLVCKKSFNPIVSERKVSKGSIQKLSQDGQNDIEKYTVLPIV